VTISSVQVPQYGVYGEHAVLWCKYTSVQPVYSVRWYKNGKEFFSYLPGKASPITVHNLSGIHVEMSKSNMNYVTLSPLTLASTGRYRCEVSEEGPMFATDSAYGDLLVVVTPQQGPIINGAKSRYFLGEKLSINCTSAATLPPANLTLYINQKLVPVSQTVSYPIENSINGRGEVLQTAVLGLERTVTREDVNFQHPRMTIKCVASIYSAYYKTVEITASLKPKRKLKRRREEAVTEHSDQDPHNKGDANHLVSAAAAGNPGQNLITSLQKSCFILSINIAFKHVSLLNTI